MDNFLFSAAGRQTDYDEYYAAVANDAYHQELAAGDLHSPISKVQSERLRAALGDFFAAPRKVLDFGCGEASLLVELASKCPASTFFGFDPGPAADVGLNKAKTLGLENICICDLERSISHGPYDLVIVSQVVEHLIDFRAMDLLSDVLAPGGLLYIEVPDPLHYEAQERLEFLYYMDRLHVNHFTPQSLARLTAKHGFGYMQHFEYCFPYRDGGEYPAFGALFRKGMPDGGVTSPSILDAANRYIEREKVRAGAVATQLKAFDGILVWGVGDNFYRSVDNGGPLQCLPNMVLLDRRQQEVTIGSLTYGTKDPLDAIRAYDWPVVITVSEGRKTLSQRVADIDPTRRIFFA